MEVTLESVEKNKKLYDENIRKIMEERAELMKQVSELRKKRATLTDEIDIAKLDFEEARLVQQINDLTDSFKDNKLTLEQLGLQQDRLETKIDKETYSIGMVANRKAKEDLSKVRELDYCENEVRKCEKALKLYTLMGDTESIAKWQEALNKANRSLEFAKKEIDNEQKVSDEKDKNKEEKAQAPYINEYGEIVRPDNVQKEENTEEQLPGYSYEKKDGVIIEEWYQALKDSSGKEIGNRTSVEKYTAEGIRTIETTGEIENEDGKYTINEFGRGDENGELIQKQMAKYSKITGEKEELSYQKDSKGETYSRKANGQITFKITKTDKGVSIDEYRNGQPYSTYEYDENGKAIDGMGMAGIEQLDENYVENFFDSQVPYFEAEFVNKPTQEKETENGDILKSAVEATEETTTSTSMINQQAQNIRDMKKEKAVQQEKDGSGVNR